MAAPLTSLDPAARPLPVDPAPGRSGAAASPSARPVTTASLSRIPGGPPLPGTGSNSLAIAGRLSRRLDARRARRPFLAWLFKLPDVLDDADFGDEGLVVFTADDDMTRHRPRAVAVQRISILPDSMSAATMDELQVHLGRDLVVVTDGIERGDVVVTGSTDGSTISSLHAAGDIVVLAVVADESCHHQHGAVIAALDAGADACVDRPNLVELAAHLRAISRRHRRSQPAAGWVGADAACAATGPGTGARELEGVA